MNKEDQQSSALVTMFLPSLREGGAEKVMVLLANSLTERGYRVDLVLVECVGPNLQSVSPAVRLVDLGAKRVVTSFIPLSRYLIKEKPDAILSTMQHANIVCCIAKRFFSNSSKLVIRQAGAPTNSMGTGGIKKNAMLHLTRWSHKFADVLVSVSRGVDAEVRETFKLESRLSHIVINNPVISDELYRLSKVAVEDKFQPWFKLPVVLAMGRLSPEKGYPDLLHAFARVLSSKKCNLVILGTGELKTELEKIIDQLGIRQNVLMAGFLENPFSCLKQASVFALASSSEGLPNALIEAMALGTTVVSTRWSEYEDEILEGGRWGKLVDRGNPEELADAIIFSLDNPTSVPIHEKWWNRFEKESIVDQYEQVLDVTD